MKKIVKALETDWYIISKIYSACSKWLAEQGWSEWYRITHLADKERVIRRIRNLDIFILFSDDKPVGTMSLQTKPLGFYRKYNFWEEPASDAFYLSMLAVSPEHHKKGNGTFLLSFAEERALEYGIQYVRLDVIAKYKELNDFYVKRGYRMVGKDTIKAAGGINIALYEKKIGLVHYHGK